LYAYLRIHWKLRFLPLATNCVKVGDKLRQLLSNTDYTRSHSEAVQLQASIERLPAPITNQTMDLALSRNFPHAGTPEETLLIFRNESPEIHTVEVYARNFERLLDEVEWLRDFIRRQVTRRMTIVAFRITAERDLHLFPKDKAAQAIKFALGFGGGSILIEVLRLLWFLYIAADPGKLIESAWITGGLATFISLVLGTYLWSVRGVRIAYETR